jgi:preprotein translocase subunit SecG
MKPNTTLILTLNFISLSVWLSFTVKKANSEIAKKNKLLQHSEEQNR